MEDTLCAGCGKKFKKFSLSRKLNCGICDQIFCDNCCKNSLVPKAGNQAVRVCDACFAKSGSTGGRPASKSTIKRPERPDVAAPPAVPMKQPPDAEVNVLFEAYMEEEGFKNPVREKMRALPITQKWIVIQQNNAKGQGQDKDKEQPSYWSKILVDTPSTQITKEQLVDLREVMKSKGTKSWVMQFYKDGGLQSFFGLLELPTAPGVRQEVLTCLGLFMKNQMGFQLVIQHPLSAEALVGVLKKDETPSADRVAVLNMLSSIVLDESRGDAGWHAVVKACRPHFKILVNFCQAPVRCPKCDAELPTYAPSCYDCKAEIGFELVIATMRLINLMIECEKDLDSRIVMRRSMEGHGLLKAIQRMQSYCSKVPELKAQCELFDTLFKEDTRDMMWAAVDGKKPINLGDIDMLFSSVRQSAMEDGEIGKLVEVLRSLLVIRSDTARTAWPLVADIVYAAVTGDSTAAPGTSLGLEQLKQKLDEKAAVSTGTATNTSGDVYLLSNRIRVLENELAAKSAELNNVLQNRAMSPHGAPPDRKSVV